MGKIILCQLLSHFGRNTRKVFNVAVTSIKIQCMGPRKSDLRPPTAYWRSSHRCAIQISAPVLCADTALSDNRQQKNVISRKHTVMEGGLHLFSILEHNGSEWSTSRPAHFSPEKKTLCPFYTGALWAPQFRSGKQSSFLIRPF